MDLIDRQEAVAHFQRIREASSDTTGYNEGFADGLDFCISFISTLPSAEPRWIPVSERLPKQGQEVLCQCRANIIKVFKLDANGYWYQDAERCYMSGFVIAWMPLPKSYRGDR